MIIFDYSRLAIAGVIALIGRGGDKVETDLARHFILNTIRASKVKLQNQFGKDVVIACDSRRYWRKDVYPYYKANRKAGRDASSIDWEGIFEASQIVKEELKEHFPYKVIEVSGAEADDVIGTICHAYGNDMSHRIVLVADDKDFFQLQGYINVHQYDPIRRKGMINCPNPARYLREHIIRGDSGDGIPNCLSDDDTFVTTGKRSKPIRDLHLQKWLGMSPEEAFMGEQLRGYRRNEQLIDLSFIPYTLRINIMEEFHAQQAGDNSKLMQYFMDKRLRNLLEAIGDF